MRTKVLVAMSAIVFAASTMMAGAQPPSNAGQYKPSVSSASPPGPDGASGMAILSAVVDSDASVARGAGVTGGVHLGTGSYEVDFNRNVSACTYNVIVGTVGAGSIQGLANDEARAGNVNGVHVETFDLVGKAADKPFHLVVFCAK